MPRSTSNLSRFRPGFAKKGRQLVCLLAVLIMAVGPVQASVTYNYGAAAVITSSSLINASYQVNQAPTALSALNQSTVPVNIASSGVVNSTVDGNTLYSRVLANSSSVSTDIALVSGSAAGSALASVNAQENDTITAFSRVSGTSVTSTLTNPATGSSASLSGNSITAETGLNTTVQTAQGVVNTSFDSNHPGTATTTATTLAGDAGLFVGSAQINDGVTPITDESNFAEVSGTNQIALTVDGTLGSSLSLAADDNSISAAFTGNNAENLLAVEAGGATALTSSAGIANLQVNDGVVPGNGGASAVVAESSISASIQDSLTTTSSLSFDGNSLQAAATGSVADNRLTVEAGLNVDADGGQWNRLDFTAGSETATTSGGLFLNNTQIAAASRISAAANDPAAAAALSVDSRGLISSALTADGNSFEAIALGNDAYGSITVGGATSFASDVAASNLQAAHGSPVSATASSGTLTVNLGGSPTLLDTENDITGSTISVNNNEISALAVANRDPLLVSITGTAVTDVTKRLDYLQVVNVTGSERLLTQAGISAISSQSATGSTVTANNTGTGINLAAGGYPDSSATQGPHISDSSFVQSGNAITSLANLNEGLVAVGITANTLDASSTAASVQNASESNVTATTSGEISTGLSTENSDVVDPSNLSVLVGDANPSDGVNTGNIISSTAGGNLNATALQATATTTMKVTRAIDKNSASSDVLMLSTAAATNQIWAEMAVLTDQRLASNNVSATTEASQIAGTVRISSDPLSNSTLKVDGNQVTATARGNLTSNDLEFSALTVDMAEAEGGSPLASAGSNLASMGAVQIIGAGSAVESEIQAGTTYEIFSSKEGEGNLNDFELSVNGNSVVASATGNTGTSSLSGTGGSLAQDVPGSLAGSLRIYALPTIPLNIDDTAAANAVVQSNAGTVTAELATANPYDIIAESESLEHTNSVITADGNRAVALATGTSAEADTTLAFNTLESSAATAVQQLQAGTTTATVGGDGAVTIGAWTPLNTNLINSTLSASGNTAGAQATGATAMAGLTAGGEDTVTLASGYSNTAAGPSVGIDADTGATTLSADYMLGVQQVVSSTGTTTASADDLSVYVQAGNLAGGSLLADGNFLTAQATGGSSSGALTLAASDMTAGGTNLNTVNAALVTEQFLAGAVGATLNAADVSATAVDLTTAATGTNGAEAVSVNDNTLLAAGTGLKSVNTLTTTADTSVAGGATEPIIATDLLTGGGSATIGNVDRLIGSFQDVQATGAVTVNVTNTSVGALVTGDGGSILGDIQGDSLTVDRNKLLAQGTGAGSSNTLATSAGASISDLTQAIVAGQDLDGAVTVSNSTSAATLDITGISTSASLSVSANQFGAAATGLTGSNTLSLSAPASISDAIGSLYTQDILSVQLVNAPVTASLTTSEASLDVLGGDVTGSALKVDGNLQSASAQGATNANILTAQSGAINDVDFQIGAYQYSEDLVTASNSGSLVGIDIDDGAATGSSLSLADNSISATAGNLNGANTLSVDSLTSNTGDTSAVDFVTMTLAGGRAEADRTIASIQDVTAGGDVSANVTGDPQMTINVSTEVQSNSTVYLKDNAIASTAAVASNSNSLNNTAETFLNSSSLIADYQASLADATALTSGADLGITIGSSVSVSSVALTGNQVAAKANGLTAENSLEVSAGSMQGLNADGSINATAANQDIDGFSAIASWQDTDSVISATVTDPDLTISSTDVSNSSIDLDANLVQASSTAASATNTLMQLADTSMAFAPALLAASQTIAGTSTAAISAADISADTDAVTASKITVDDNTIEALAAGGTMTNYLDPGAGTRITALIENPDPSVTALSSNFLGSYGLVARQASTAAVTATNTTPSVSLAIDDDITANSALSTSGNILRAQATNLSADNGLVTAAGTALDDVSSGVLNYQSVGAATAASTSASSVSLTGGNLIGIAAADENWMVAIATGGTATNDLDVSGLSISHAPVGGLSSLAASTAPLGTESGSESLASVLNVQERTEAVTATLSNGGVSSTLSDVSGSVSASKNLMAAQARGLVADNRLDVASETSIDGGSSALGSVQYSDAATSASINTGSVTLTTQSLTGTSALNDNTALASATSNLAVNRLNASAGTQIDDLGESTETSVNGTSMTAATAGFALQNLQQGAGEVNATVSNLNVQSSMTALNGTADVDGNTVFAQARGQAAQNSLVLDAGTVLNASASLANSQDNSGAINAAVTTGAISLNAPAVTGTASVDNNTVQASGTANLAINSMDISGTLAASGGGSSTATSGTPLNITSTADYVALNAQNNSADVTSSVSGFTVALNDTAVSTSFNGTAGVNNNMILADATGNSAVNTFTINPKASTDTADFAFTGVQMNSGNISSTISGATISLSSAGSTGTFSAGGNRIGAVSTGNVSVSSIKSGF